MLRFKNQNLANLRQTFAISAAAPFQLIFLLIGTFSRKVLTEFRNRFCEWKKVNRTTTSSFGILSLFLRNDLTSFPSFLPFAIITQETFFHFKSRVAISLFALFFQKDFAFTSCPVWPDLAKFRHFGTILKVLGKFLRVCLVFGKILILLWKECYAIGQVFIVVDGHIL